MSKDRLLKFNLADAKINGIVCSTNKRQGMVRSIGISLECDTILRGNAQLLSIHETNIYLFCPKNCASKK